ncbi:hypothetical protein E2C00_24495 [Streptomyces sp. WAC05374]|nr:hypothetical protein E2B92_18275 [Streptomyces sp. WAC05374]TDF51939.1 hypothetical protein E2C00_24495 [Streptomyces sp. WAC05374]TDF54294.1 hypothetical protein E2C02_16890 [Streptomyces sp. WAC05374]
MSTGSFIARPTETGYTGIYVHLDGQPSEKLPILLTAHRYRFGRDVKAMAQHLVDGVAVGWDELGTDLLDGAPPEILSSLTGGEQWASSTLDHLVTPDGSPPVRMTVTEKTAADLDVQWGYILRPHGIEVISVLHATAGPLVAWGTDPRAPFSNHPAHWSAPASAAAPSARPAPTSPSVGPRTAARR